MRRMKAAIRTGLLGRTITFREDHPHPIPKASAALKPTEILIRVKSAAINPADYKLPSLIAGKVVGIDVSGTVEDVGSDVADFHVGDHVFGRAINSKVRLTGSLTEYTLVNMDEVAKKPAWLTFSEAASIGIAYLTGIQALRAGNMKKGSSVLIIGASGGCGLAGVQLAIAMGASRVACICSGKNFDFVREMSGNKKEELEFVDYTDGGALSDFKEKSVGKFHCIYDTASGSGKGEDYASSFPKLLKPKTAKLIQINGGPSIWIRYLFGRMKPQTGMITTAPRGKSDLEEIVSLLKSTGAKPFVNENPFDGEGVANGFEQLKGRHTKGKIVFNVC